MENNQAIVPKFSVKSAGFFLVWGSYVVSCCRVFYYGLSVCRLILVP